MIRAVALAAAVAALASLAVGGTSASFSRTVSNSSSLTAAADFRPLNSTLPVVTGTIGLLNTLTATPGDWTNDQHVTPVYTYQWEYCADALVSACVTIPGETGLTYQITLASIQAAIGGIVASLPLNAHFRVVETATNTWGFHSAASEIL